MRKHAHLTAMVGFVRNHVAQHFGANGPGPGPAVAEELLDTAPAAERLGEHFRATRAALGQCLTYLTRRAVRAAELRWNLQMRSCEPDPLAADIVQVREDGSNRTDLALRSRFPCGRIQMRDEHLVQTVVHSEDLHCCRAEFRVSVL